MINEREDYSLDLVSNNQDHFRQYFVKLDEHDKLSDRQIKDCVMTRNILILIILIFKIVYTINVKLLLLFVAAY